MAKRITVPEGSVPVILEQNLAHDLFKLLRALRTPKRNLRERLDQINAASVAGDVMLAMFEFMEPKE